MKTPDPRASANADAQPRSAKTCTIFAEPPGSAHYGWGWQSGAKRSKALFRYFYECVRDARKHGYAVDFAAVADSLKPSRRDASAGG